MARKVRKPRISSKEAKEPTYTYARVEAALGSAFHATDRRLLIVRARLKSFQRAGLTPSSPGRGKVIRYRKVHIYTWALALALADFGLGPEAISLMLLQVTWFEDWYFPVMQGVAKVHPDGTEEHLYFALMPHVLTDTRVPSIVKGHVLLDRVYAKPPPTYTLLAGSWISGERIGRLGGRVAFVDLTTLKDAVDAAL